MPSLNFVIYIFVVGTFYGGNSSSVLWYWSTSAKEKWCDTWEHWLKDCHHEWWNRTAFRTSSTSTLGVSTLGRRVRCSYVLRQKDRGKVVSPQSELAYNFFGLWPKHMFCEVTETGYHHTLINSSQSPSGHLCQIWRDVPQVFSIASREHNAAGRGC